jgi:predicted Rossmann fold nucleotide-binding protein DprA/Smf involved in DNA uptake
LRTHWDEQAPECLFLLGNTELLRGDSLALFCSIKCPAGVILKTYDLARALRDAGVPIVGGFHTPMRRECLALLLRGAQPIVVCPARGLEGSQPPPDVQDEIKAGRVLLVSMFGSWYRRATAELADQRNHLVVIPAGMALMSHAAPARKTEALCREIMAMGKPLFTMHAPENANLLALGAKPLVVEALSVLLPGTSTTKLRGLLGEVRGPRWYRLTSGSSGRCCAPPLN